MNFSNKTAFITGAARGIGRNIAEKFAEYGANIVICDMNLGDSEKTAAEISAQFKVKALGVMANVTSKEQLLVAAETTVQNFGSLDIWVNNAGVLRDNLLIRMSEEEWDLVLDVNLKGCFLGTQVASKYMLKAKKGRIVNISSIAGLIGNAGQANYSAAKAGVIALTKSSARELASRNITVNAITPGYVQTTMTAALPEKVQESLAGMIPLAYKGSPEDIAFAARFLASDEAAFITGSILRVDGGMAIGM